MARRGWQKESARHSLASRGVMSKRRLKHTGKPAVQTVKQQPKLKQEPAEQDIENICAQLEERATSEAGSKQEAAALLTNQAWIASHVDELIVSFSLDNGIRTSLIAKVRKRYESDGRAERPDVKDRP